MIRDGSDMGQPPVPEGLTDEAKAEISEAIRIVKEDRIYNMISTARSGKAAEGSQEGSQAQPPPPKEDPVTGTPPKRSGLWWGDQA